MNIDSKKDYMSEEMKNENSLLKEQNDSLKKEKENLKSRVSNFDSLESENKELKSKLEKLQEEKEKGSLRNIASKLKINCYSLDFAKSKEEIVIELLKNAKIIKEINCDSLDYNTIKFVLENTEVSNKDKLKTEEQNLYKAINKDSVSKEQFNFGEHLEKQRKN